MYNIKKKLSGLLMLSLLGGMLSGCEKKPQTEQNAETKPYLIEIDYSQLQDQDKQTGYKTTVLQKKTYQVSYTNIATPIYDKKAVCLDAPYGYKEFITFTVKDGQYMKAGDVIMRYHISFDPIDIAQTTLTLQRETEKFEAYKTTETQRLSQYLKAISELDPASEVYAASMQDYLEQMEILEDTLSSMQETLDGIQEKMDWMAYDDQDLEVVAPTDGCIELERIMWSIEHQTNLAWMYDPHTLYYYVKDDFNNFSYGQSVTATYKDENGVQKTVTGKVIASNQLMSNPWKEDGAVLLMNFPEEMTEVPKELKTSIVTVNIPEAIGILKSAICKDGNYSYVEILKDDGSTERRYIDIVSEQSQEVIVLDASLDGCQVILR